MISRLFQFSAVVIVLIGLYYNFVLGNTSIDIQLHDTMYVLPSMMVYIFCAFPLIVLAILYYSFSHIFEGKATTIFGAIHFAITIISMLCVIVPLGSMTGLPRRYYTYANFETFNDFNHLAEFMAIMFTVFLIAQAAFVFYFSALLIKRAIK